MLFLTLYRSPLSNSQKCFSFFEESTIRHEVVYTIGTSWISVVTNIEGAALPAARIHDPLARYYHLDEYERDLIYNLYK